MRYLSQHFHAGAFALPRQRMRRCAGREGHLSLACFSNEHVMVLRVVSRWQGLEPHLLRLINQRLDGGAQNVGQSPEGADHGQTGPGGCGLHGLFKSLSRHRSQQGADPVSQYRRALTRPHRGLHRRRAMLRLHADLRPTRGRGPGARAEPASQPIHHQKGPGLRMSLMERDRRVVAGEPDRGQWLAW